MTKLLCFVFAAPPGLEPGTYELTARRSAN
jgi:hypothetical protein